MKDGPLDMRMNQKDKMTASKWLTHAKEQEISWVLKTYGEERFHKKIAKKINFYKNYFPKKKIHTTKQLKNIITRSIPFKEKKKHPATRSFQAIRIYINNELKEITEALKSSLNLLAPNGRLVVISFHSLEDRIVKNFINQNSQNKIFPLKLPLTNQQIKEINKKLKLKKLKKIKPKLIEILKNKRSRSAILRTAEFLE